MKAAIIGAGPAGLMAAEVLAEAGATVHVYDGMPSAGRKFLLAGRGGLNLTHSEVPTKVAMPSPCAHSRTACGPKSSSQRATGSRLAP